MSKGKTVIVLGGGVGGLVTASMLRRRLPSEHRIVLVDRQKTHLFQPSLLWMMVGRRSISQIERPLSKLAKKGIEIVHGTVESIDPDNRSVVVDGHNFEGDFLVVALGVELTPEDVPGLVEGGHNFYTPEGAESFEKALNGLDSGKIAVLTAVPMYKCPAAPYEAAMLIDDHCRRRGVREKVGIKFYAAEPGPMGVAGPVVSAGVKAMLAERQIDYHPEHQIVNVDAEAGKLSFANGAVATYGLLAYVPPHKAPSVVADAGMVGDAGWIAVDRNTLETRFPRVYAIGDVISIPLQMGKPLPKAGVFAHGEAEVVAENISAEILGRQKEARFDGHGSCFVEAGGAKAGFGSGDFFAEPLPDIRLRPPGRFWHVGKVLFEKFWLWKWF